MVGCGRVEGKVVTKVVVVVRTTMMGLGMMVMVVMTAMTAMMMMVVLVRKMVETIGCGWVLNGRW